MNPVEQLLLFTQQTAANMEHRRRAKCYRYLDRDEISISYKDAVTLTERLFGFQDKRAYLAIAHIPCSDKDLDFWFVTLADHDEAGTIAEALSALEDKLPPGSSLEMVTGTEVCLPPALSEMLTQSQPEDNELTGR